MGSAAKTKHGKVYRAPVDQARKQERQRIIKKNRKERQQVRLAIAKHTEVDECIGKMVELERQIAGLDTAKFAMDVLKKKQKTIMDIIDKRRGVLTAVKDDAEIKELNEKMRNYHLEVQRIRQLAEQEQMARSLNPLSIPLPEGEIKKGDDRTYQLMGPRAAEQVRKEKEKARRLIPRHKRRPPGPPCGNPPSFSDSEGEEDPHVDVMDDNNLDPVPIPEELMRGRPQYQGIPQPRFPGLPLRHAPGPPSQLPLPPIFRGNIPLRPEAAVISGAPQIRSRPVAPAPAEPTVLEAAPQLRDLRSEAIKLVPTVLKRKPIAPVAPKIHRARPAQEHAKSTDDAYNDFMKELGDLL